MAPPGYLELSFQDISHYAMEGGVFDAEVMGFLKPSLKLDIAAKASNLC